MRRILIISLLILFLSGGCEAAAVSTPQPTQTETAVPTEPTAQANGRLFHLSITEAEGEPFDDAFRLAQSAGAQATSLSVYWDDIEIAPGIYQPDPNWLAIANAYYPAQQMQVSLAISVIDTNNLRLPADLADKSFDDPELIARFNSLLDYVAAQLTELTPQSLAIGNEIDLYLGSDVAQWRAYETFFVETAAYARTLWPNTLVGSKVTFEGIADERAAAIQSLNQHADVVLVTYYPLDGGFQVRPPTAVHDDFQTLADAFPDKTIHLLEVGYPTGTANGSSEAMQAQFIHELFLAWDDHAEQIPVLNYTWLTDMPETAVADMTDYYRLDDPAFVSFLATLGLRTGDGSPKPAFDQLLIETETRGWR
ncbi:hypothetical protein [Candidatus Leptofilum sp.]|uniref:hypothetical protein n=1 Tax=Candidatus Leptofilum sp. TaxID=3241576 RepID=UPI003B5B55B3